MRPDDIPAGLRLCRAADWNQVAADWELFLASSPDGCVSPSTTLTRSSAASRQSGTDNDFSWIAMVLVDPPHRGKGIGRQLLKEALDVIGEATTARLDATPAGRAVYVPLGFREEYWIAAAGTSGHGPPAAAAREMEASAVVSGLSRTVTSVRCRTLTLMTS